VSVEHVFYCDWRECRTNVQTASASPELWLTVTDGTVALPMYFCSWDCVLKYAGEVPPVEVIQL
jgi:hypothetical protein